jgi:hypothetical protein
MKNALGSTIAAAFSSDLVALLPQVVPNQYGQALVILHH